MKTRSINSASMCGSFAVVVTVVAWYFFENEESIKIEVMRWLKKEGPTALTRKGSVEAGQVICNGLNLYEKIRNNMMANECARYSIKFAEVKLPYNAQRYNEFFDKIVAEQIGQIVKESGWFEKNKKEIAAEKRKLKVIKGVLNK